ncbi:MAG: heavy metal translocating P-type ATPase [Alphaproteobacteria bacterium]|nr:heavy metal translocating P-type ATPase [Alphaproteobacteria bacterium]
MAHSHKQTTEISEMHEHHHCCCGHCHHHEEARDSHEHSHEHSHSHNDECGCGHNHNHGGEYDKWILSLSAVLYLAVIVVEHFMTISPMITDGIFYVLYLLCGFSVLKEAFKGVLQKDFFNEFTLMTIATLGAVAISELPEAVGVMLFYRIGEALQEYAANKSRNSIKSLLDSKPESAHLIEGEEIREIRVEEIRIGQEFQVKSGERVPTDAVVLKGQSHLDTSSITGEFMPIEVFEGTEVLGGSINIGGVLVVKALKEFRDTSVARTMELVENSAKTKAPTEKFISKFAKVYTPIVFFLALAVATIPPLFFGQPWETWIYRSLVMLVISCPCALVISIPLSYFASMGAASRLGILIKGGVVIDALTSVDMVAFDKTGTLTKGELTISAIKPVEGVSEAELLELAKEVEQYSNHPIAQTILGNDSLKHNETAEVEEVAGQGLLVKLGKETYLAGNAKLLKAHQVIFEEEESFGTLIYIAKNKAYQGVIVLNDTIKPEAVKTVAEIKKQGMLTYMLTGDNEKSASYVAEKVGVDEYQAELLPEDKLYIVEELHKSSKVMFVGDGTNDAPVLANASVGVAMGGLGSKLAIEVSDGVILNDDISKVLTLLNLAKRTKTIVWQNISLALGVKTLFMVLGIVGVSGLWEAVFADVGVSVLAILNAIRLLRKN